MVSCLSRELVVVECDAIRRLVQLEPCLSIQNLDKDQLHRFKEAISKRISNSNCDPGSMRFLPTDAVGVDEMIYSQVIRFSKKEWSLILRGELQ